MKRHTTKAVEEVRSLVLSEPHLMFDLVVSGLDEMQPFTDPEEIEYLLSLAGFRWDHQDEQGTSIQFYDMVPPDVPGTFVLTGPTTEEFAAKVRSLTVNEAAILFGMPLCVFLNVEELYPDMLNLPSVMKKLKASLIRIIKFSKTLDDVPLPG